MRSLIRLLKRSGRNPDSHPASLKSQAGSSRDLQYIKQLWKRLGHAEKPRKPIDSGRPKILKLSHIAELPIVENPRRMKRKEIANGCLALLDSKLLHKGIIKLAAGSVVADVVGKARRIGTVTKTDKDRVHISWTEDEMHVIKSIAFEPYEEDLSIQQLIKAGVAVVVFPKRRE